MSRERLDDHGGPQMRDDALPACPVEGFLRDALNTGLSMWTVANVLRVWVADGTCREEVTEALIRVRKTSPPSRSELLDAYASAVDTLLT